MRELTLEMRHAANLAFATSEINGGTATDDRLLFWDGFAAGKEWQESEPNPLQAKYNALLAVAKSVINESMLNAILEDAK